MRTSVNWMTGNPPNKTKRYLVTYRDGNVGTCLWSSGVCYYNDIMNGYSWVYPKGEVIAYAEVPTPYKGISSNLERK